MIVEVSYPFTLQDAGDTAANLPGEDSLHRGYPATLRGTGSHRENATLFDFRIGNELTPAADFPSAIRGR